MAFENHWFMSVMMLPKRIKNASIWGAALDEKGDLSRQFNARGIQTLGQAFDYVAKLPYRLNYARDDYRLVLEENQGTCSTKHALLVKLAEEIGESIQLTVGIMQMKPIDFPCLKHLLQTAHIDYFPEAHCYVTLEGFRVDATFPLGVRCLGTKRLMEEHAMPADDIGEPRRQLYHAFLKNWLQATYPHMTLDALLTIREQAIQTLSKAFS